MVESSVELREDEAVEGREGRGLEVKVMARGRCL
jgi:hypothetical protein